MPQAEKVLAGKWTHNPAVLSVKLRTKQASWNGGSARYDKYRKKIQWLTLAGRSMTVRGELTAKRSGLVEDPA